MEPLATTRAHATAIPHPLFLCALFCAGFCGREIHKTENSQRKRQRKDRDRRLLSEWGEGVSSQTIFRLRVSITSPRDVRVVILRVHVQVAPPRRKLTMYDMTLVRPRAGEEQKAALLYKK